MTLKSDNYDPSSEVEYLLKSLRWRIGGPAYRSIEPEMRLFFHTEVAEALLGAFSAAESIYLREMCDQSDKASATLLRGILAGVELGHKDAA